MVTDEEDGVNVCVQPAVQRIEVKPFQNTADPVS